LIGLLTVVIVLSVWTSGGPSALYGDAFKPLPKNMRVFGEITFTRLPDSQLSRVQVTPSDAARIVKANYGSMERWRVVFESLGGYVNNNEIIHDWIGTKSLVPKALPAYIVRITGPPIVALGPSSVVNHYWNVIVNAITGRIVSSFTYD
jgi:hypothetical protein